LVFAICLAYGILNAGGRNVIICCNSLRGENSVLSTVGLAISCNFFSWHALALMPPLSFHPTLIIGLDKDLRVPKWEIRNSGKKNLFTNPPNFASELAEKCSDLKPLAPRAETTLRAIIELHSTPDMHSIPLTIICCITMQQFPIPQTFLTAPSPAS
jgi:hypothetical protein